MGTIASVGESLTVSTVVKVLTAATYLHAVEAVLQVLGQPVRYYCDGRTPTSTTGVLVYDGGLITLKSRFEMVNFKAIRDTNATGDATLEAVYRK